VQNLRDLSEQTASLSEEWREVYLFEDGLIR
jgi:hypothetical protein